MSPSISPLDEHNRLLNIFLDQKLARTRMCDPYYDGDHGHIYHPTWHRLAWILQSSCYHLLVVGTVLHGRNGFKVVHETCHAAETLQGVRMHLMLTNPRAYELLYHQQKAAIS